MNARFWFVLALSAPLTAQLPNWFQRSVVSMPSTGPFLMQYDPVAHRCLLVDRGAAGQTWSWDGRSWELRAASAPIADDAQMVWDSVRQRMLVVASGTTSGRTRIWQWRNDVWQAIYDARPMLGREAFAAAFDDARGVLVLHGGIMSGSTNMNDTWEYDGSTWRQRSAGGPSPRDSHTLTYDPERRVCVLFGGQNDDHSPYRVGDVWEWDGSQWREFFGVTGPAPRMRALATYDTVHHRVLVYGGLDQGFFHDLWAWNGASWQLIRTAVAPPQHLGALAFDPARGVAVLQTFPSASTWEFYDDTPLVGTFTTFGAGCAGTNGTPLLAAAGSPRIGETFGLSIAPVSQHVLGQTFGILGLSTTNWNGLALPFALDQLGAPGCMLLVGIEDSVSLARNGTTATWPIPIPFDRRLVGHELDVQGLVVDPGVNAAGVVVSNAARLVIGN